MTARRPIVTIDGQEQQLPAGDTVLGVPTALPAKQVSGLLLRIPLTTQNALVVARTGDTALNVQVVTNG